MVMQMGCFHNKVNKEQDEGAGEDKKALDSSCTSFKYQAFTGLLGLLYCQLIVCFLRYQLQANCKDTLGSIHFFQRLLPVGPYSFGMNILGGLQLGLTVIW
jgi:hypothetical protein